MIKQRIFYVIAICTLFLNGFDNCYSQSLLLQKCLGGSMEDEGYGIRQTPDGGFIVCGTIESNDGDVNCLQGEPDGWLVKLDASFNIEWKKCFGAVNLSSYLYSLDVTTDNGYIIGGGFLDNIWGVAPCSSYGDNEYWVIKTDSVGNVQWQNCYGGTGRDEITDIHQTLDGGYIVAGNTSSTDGDVIGGHGGSYDFWILKLDSSGNKEWSRAFGDGNGVCATIVETDDNCFIACGAVRFDFGDVTGTHGGFDFWVIKIDSTGNLLWQKALGGSNDDGAFDLVATSGGGAIVIGEASSTDGDLTVNLGSWDTWLIQLDQNGSIVWQKSYGGSGYDSGRCIAKSLDGGYMLLSTGSSIDGQATCNLGSQFWFAKIDSVGNFISQVCIGGSEFEIPQRIISTFDSSYAAIGRTSSDNDGDVSGNHSPCAIGFCWDFWVVKVGSTTTDIYDLQMNTKSLTSSYSVNERRLTLFWLSSRTGASFVQIFDITGKEVYTNRLKSFPGENILTIPFETIGSQMYFVRISEEGSSFTGRFIGY